MQKQWHHTTYVTIELYIIYNLIEKQNIPETERKAILVKLINSI